MALCIYSILIFKHELTRDYALLLLSMQNEQLATLNQINVEYITISDKWKQSRDLNRNMWNG